jgi:two-component system phosphate regulon sensor histidine kinase PhoR
VLERDELTAIVVRLKEGVVAVDPRMRVAFANAGAASLFEPATLTLGKPLPAVPSDPEFGLFVEHLFDSRPGAIGRRVERDDASFEVLGVPAHNTRRVAALIITNVTEQSRRERARTEFVANAAHELLTPLTGIASAAHVLESGAKEDPELRDRFLDHIARECSRLTRVAGALLVLARAQ